MRALRDFVTQVRADLISQVLEPGRFSSPESGLTFHIRDRSLNGDLLGLLVHDERDDKQVMSYLAERGRIITNDEGSYLVMFDGYVHRYNSEDKDKTYRSWRSTRTCSICRSSLRRITPAKNFGRARVIFSDLINPDMNDRAIQRNYGQIRSELHDRLSTPLYPLAFAFIAIALLAHAAHHAREPLGPDSPGFRHRAWASGLQDITAGNLVALNPWAVVLVYGIPLGAILVAAWTAHVRMAPRAAVQTELRA